VSLLNGAVRCGPFEYIARSYEGSGTAWGPEPVVWASDDSRLAFVGRSLAGYELWLLDLVQGTGVCRMTIPRAERPRRNGVAPLAWSRDGTRLFAIVGGFQTTGQYKGKTGWWVVSVPVEEGRVRTVAFMAGGGGEGDTTTPRVTPDGSAVILAGENIRRLELETGRVRSWPRWFEASETSGELRQMTSPSAAAVAWDLVGSRNPGAGVYVLDTRAGSKTLIAPPADLADTWHGLVGWSPGGDLLAVEFARPEDVETDEGERAYVVGRVAVGLYDASGAERCRLTPASEGWRIGDYVWSPDGTAIAYLQGTVGEAAGELHPMKVFRARELWIWQKDSGKSQRLLAASEVERLEWVTKSIICIRCRELGAQYLELTRKGDSWMASPTQESGATVLGEHGVYVYVWRRGEAGPQVLAVRDAVETLVYEGSLDYTCLWFGDKRLSFPVDLITSTGASETYLVVVPVP